jgi:GT2 family glycosyltransferase
MSRFTTHTGPPPSHLPRTVAQSQETMDEGVPDIHGSQPAGSLVQSLDHVAVVVLDYNQETLTTNCIRSILSHNAVDIIVVQNGRPNHTYAALGSRIHLVFNNANLGFATGMNRGIERALELGADVVLLLNNDTLVEEGALALLAARLRSDPEVGVVGPDLLFSVGILARHSKPTQSRLHSEPVVQIRRRIPFYCVGMRRDLFQSVGLLDEDFFFGKEDDEFCSRASRHGYKIAEVRGAVVNHFVSSSTRLDNHESVLFLAYHMARGRAMLTRKTGRSVTRELIGSFYESVGLMVKCYISGRRIFFDIPIGALSGFRSGLRTPLSSVRYPS